MFKRTKKIMKDKKGFTLIELIVVIAVLAILAAIAVPQFSGFTGKANKANDDQLISTIKKSITVSYADGTLTSTNTAATFKLLKGDPVSFTPGDSGGATVFSDEMKKLVGTDAAIKHYTSIDVTITAGSDAKNPAITVVGTP